MKKILLFVLFTFQFLIAQQVQFETRVSKNTLGANERLRVDFVMNVDGDDLSQPSFEGFRVIAGPSAQVSSSWVNGKTSFEKAYSYFLVPASKGVHTIKGATMTYNGQTYRSNPVKVTVTNAVDLPKDPDEPQPINEDTNIYLVAETSKTNPYVNEPITIVYKLYFGHNIGITNWKEYSKPTYNDFWSQNIDIKQLVPEEGMFKGQRYRFVVLRKTVLYPQKSGKLNIEPLSLDIDVQLPTNRRDFFGRVQIVEGTRKVSSGNKVIVARPLPEAGKPADFSGAVGSFTFKATPSKTQLKNGESLDLNVSVSGTGNLKLFDIPKPIVPNALEMYDPVHDEHVNTSLSGMNGKISDSYTIVPQYKGDYVIKPMTFSYFDLSSQTYKTLTQPQIVIQVLDGPTDQNNTKTVSNQVPKHAKQFGFIKLKTLLEPKQSEPFIGSGLYFFLLLLPLISIPVIVFARKQYQKMGQDVAGNKIKLNQKLVRTYLSEAKKQMQNKDQFYIALEKALHNFLKAKLYIETSELSKDNIREMMLQKNADSEVANAFVVLLENCEMARFARISNSELQTDFDKAIEIIAELEKQLK